jgi:hypothetical protein
MHAVEEPDRHHGALGGERQGSETVESFHHVEGNERPRSAGLVGERSRVVGHVGVRVARGAHVALVALP